MKTSMLKRIIGLMSIMGVFLFPTFSKAENVTELQYTPLSEEKTESTIVEKEKKNSHFSWGAEFGTSVDMSGYDSSTFNIDVMAGYRDSRVNLLGFGAGIHRAMGSGDNYVPLYGIMRTSFSKTKKLFFMNLKIGYSFNTIGDAPTFGDMNASLGAGINLASGKSYQSYLILGYEFRHFNQRNRSKVKIEAEDVSLVSLSFGVNF